MSGDGRLNTACEPLAGPKTTPSVCQQKAYIVENAGILNKETKLAILNIVMMEIGKSVILDSGPAKEVDIDLDMVEHDNEEVLSHIYNIVCARRDALNQPVGALAHRPPPK
jgi:hypothetical protein